MKIQDILLVIFVAAVAFIAGGLSNRDQGCTIKVAGPWIVSSEACQRNPTATRMIDEELRRQFLEFPGARLWESSRPGCIMCAGSGENR